MIGRTRVVIVGVNMMARGRVVGVKDLGTKMSNDSHGHRAAVGDEGEATRKQKATWQREMRREAM